MTLRCLLNPWRFKALINRVIRQLDSAAALGEGKKLYYANKEVYRLLRYGVKDKEGACRFNLSMQHPFQLSLSVF